MTPQYGPPSQQPYYPPPPARRPGVPAVGVAVIVFFTFVVGGCSGLLVGTAGKAAPEAAKAAKTVTVTAAAPGSKTTASPTEAADQPTKTPPGRQAEDDVFAYTVTKIEESPSVGSGYVAEKAHGKFVLVHVKIHNRADESHSFSASDQRLLSGDIAYTPDTGAAISLGGEGALFERINPGLTINATLIFDVPKNVQPTGMLMRSSSLSDGAKVTL